MASLAYLFQDGLSQEKSYDRYNGHINLDSKINKWVSVGLNASAYRGTDQDEFEGFASLLQYVNRIPPTFGIYDKDGNFKYDGLNNPVAHQGRTGLYRNIDQQIHATTSLTLTPIEGLSIKGVYSLRHDARDQRKFKKHLEYGKFNSGKREGYHNYYNWNWYTSQLLVNYNKTFDKHTIEIGRAHV